MTRAVRTLPRNHPDPGWHQTDRLQRRRTRVSAVSLLHAVSVLTRCNDSARRRSAEWAEQAPCELDSPSAPENPNAQKGPGEPAHQVPDKHPTLAEAARTSIRLRPDVATNVPLRGRFATSKTLDRYNALEDPDADATDSIVGWE
jgi:hypothetical protein